MSVSYKKEGKVHIVTISGKVGLHPVLRDQQILFSEYIQKKVSEEKYDVVINTSFYDINYVSLAAALAIERNPIGEKNTENLGRIKLKNGDISGAAGASYFYVAQSKDYTYYFGQGDFTLNARYNKLFQVAVGGMGPLIIGGLKYGNGNEYDSVKMYNDMGASKVVE